jgi:N-acetylmuramic acid 6-phosphate etherase
LRERKIVIVDIKDLTKLSTEGINPDTMNIDRISTIEVIELISREDKKVTLAVEKAKEYIAKAVDIIAEGLGKGGDLYM